MNTLTLSSRKPKPYRNRLLACISLIRQWLKGRVHLPVCFYEIFCDAQAESVPTNGDLF